jgi:hypothetical protein
MFIYQPRIRKQATSLAKNLRTISIFGAGRGLLKELRRYSWFAFPLSLAGFRHSSNRRPIATQDQNVPGHAQSRPFRAANRWLNWLDAPLPARNPELAISAEQELGTSADAISLELVMAERNLAALTHEMSDSLAVQARRVTLSGIDDLMQRWNIHAHELEQKILGQQAPTSTKFVQNLGQQSLAQQPSASSQPLTSAVPLERPTRIRTPRDSIPIQKQHSTLGMTANPSARLNQLALRPTSPSAKLGSLRTRIQEVGTNLHLERQKIGTRTGVSLDRRKSPRTGRAPLPAPSLQPTGWLQTDNVKKADETA